MMMIFFVLMQSFLTLVVIEGVKPVRSGKYAEEGTLVPFPARMKLAATKYKNSGFDFAWLERRLSGDITRKTTVGFLTLLRRFLRRFGCVLFVVDDSRTRVVGRLVTVEVVALQ